ncbi:MAG: hypothetical protein KGL39_40640, partial [Patescibacteria group bacterium]|nr:hypothetical protein [Patescibacteria group bacterium]
MSTSGPQSKFAHDIMLQKYAHDLGVNGGVEDWGGIGARVSGLVMGAAIEQAQVFSSAFDLMDIEWRVRTAIVKRKFMPGGRYLAATGRPYHQTQNCLLLRAEDSREGWAQLMYKITMSLMTGAGIGVVYSDLRGKGQPIKKTGGVSTGPCALVQMVNEAGRGIVQGGNRRSAIWAGLHWNHPDIQEFIHLKDWSESVRKAKADDYNAQAPLDHTNISVILDDDFFAAYQDKDHPQHGLADEVYWETLKMAVRTGDPGFSVDIGVNAGENQRNACCEITSRDDSDICNLGSIVISRVQSLDEMRTLVDDGTAFLLAGTLYSDVPYAKVAEVRGKNRRLGLGLMGLHEWLLRRGKKYGPDEELEQYLKIYASSTGYAENHAQRLRISAPVKTRAIAPNGTIAIVAETTSGIEPIFCAAYKRHYVRAGKLHYQYVIDPTAKRLLDEGVKESEIEDAYSIGLERRLEFQAWVQQYVDHAISGTVNIPPWGSEENNSHRI